MITTTVTIKYLFFKAELYSFKKFYRKAFLVKKEVFVDKNLQNVSRSKTGEIRFSHFLINSHQSSERI